MTQTKMSYWVEFYYPGLLMADTDTKIVKTLDPYKVKWPERAYAFRMYQREDIMRKGKRYAGKTEQIGPEYWHPDSSIQTLEQVKANPNGTKILVDNMICNSWKALIWSRYNSWPQPYDSKTKRKLEKL